jgi:hypothetical protein
MTPVIGRPVDGRKVGGVGEPLLLPDGVLLTVTDTVKNLVIGWYSGR